jgi:futalosine hydrolase
MNCLLLAATAKEIAPFLDLYRQSKGAQKKLQVDILITGIGLTAAAWSLTKQLQLKRPGLVLQAGIAGCFDKQFPLGSVVTVSQDTIADQGVVESKKLNSLFDLGLASPDQFPYKNGWLVNPDKDVLKKMKLKKVRGISVNQVSTSKQMIDYYQHKFQPVTESMEGAALHYICLMEKIPFLQIRAISNYIGERNKQKWNLRDSIINLNKVLIQFLDI